VPGRVLVCNEELVCKEEKVMRYREQLASANLRLWAECFWSVETGTPVERYAVPPDGCLDIIFSAETGLRAIGAMTMEQHFRLAAGTRSVGLRFRPGMAGAFLGVAPGELTDGIVCLADLWGRRAGEIERQLGDATSAAACLHVLEAAVIPRVGAANAVQRALGALTESGGTADLEWIATQANLSPRQFRRRCEEESGLTPKLLCRVLRFRRAWGLSGRSMHPNWAAIACEAGYFDQAHLIRDFRQFTGRTPMADFSNPSAGAAG
jgi:AraC-like DNA-binding protein